MPLEYHTSLFSWLWRGGRARRPWGRWRASLPELRHHTRTWAPPFFSFHLLKGREKRKEERKSEWNGRESRWESARERGKERDNQNISADLAEILRHICQNLLDFCKVRWSFIIHGFLWNSGEHPQKKQRRNQIISDSGKFPRNVTTKRVNDM